MKGWNLETVRRIRDEIAQELKDPAWSIRRPTYGSIVLYCGENYGCFDVQSWKGSTDGNLELFLNVGLGSFDFLKRRGFGPQKPRNYGDCLYSARIYRFNNFKTFDQTHNLSRDNPEMVVNFIIELRNFVAQDLKNWYKTFIGFNHYHDVIPLPELIMPDKP